MSDSFSSPSPPPSSNKNSSTVVVITTAVTAVIITALIVFGMSSSDKASTDVANTAANTTPYVSTSEPVSNKYDLYYEYVLDNSGRANTMSKSDVIKLGDLICQYLDLGNSIDELVKLLAEKSADTSAQELSGEGLFGAIEYLCPEYRSNLQTYIENQSTSG